MKLMKIYYSVSNGGDGSAYPHFFESEVLANIHQEYQSEGWGESCTGDLEIPECDVALLPDVDTKESCLFEMIKNLEGKSLNGEDYRDDFIALFSKVPQIINIVKDTYWYVYFNTGTKPAKYWNYGNKKTQEDLQDLIDEFFNKEIEEDETDV